MITFQSRNKKWHEWHTSYRMKGVPRVGKEYGTNKNIDCYMREFFDRAKKHEKNG